MARRTQQELFLDTLKELGGEDELVANTKLRKKLEWDDAKYKRIKSRLEENHSVVVGRGQGGTVRLPPNEKRGALDLFVSYSHADEVMKDHLLRHLDPLKHLNLVDTWHDRKIEPGDEWGGKISENLEGADIILLLISVDFINSRYCYDVELERAMERHDEEEAVVIPVILRSCLWQSSPFAKLQALPKDAKAVSSWADLDEALMNVAEGVRQVAERIIAVTVD